MTGAYQVDRHYEQAHQQGVEIVQVPTDYPYGERQYVARDPGRHRWIFSQSITDVDPQEWGATLPTSSIDLLKTSLIPKLVLVSSSSLRLAVLDYQRPLLAIFQS